MKVIRGSNVLLFAKSRSSVGLTLGKLLTDDLLKPTLYNDIRQILYEDFVVLQQTLEVLLEDQPEE